MAKNKNSRERREDPNLSVDKSRERHQMHEDRRMMNEEAAKGAKSDVKCISNFHCNGVEGKKGHFLTVDQLELIGEEHGKDLVAHGCILLPGGHVPSEPEIDAAEGLDGKIQDGGNEINPEIELVEEKGS